MPAETVYERLPLHGRRRAQVRRKLEEINVFRKTLLTAGLCAAVLFAAAARADAIPTEIEGAAGGGLSAWALTAPTAELSYWYYGAQDITLQNASISGTLFKKLELSYANPWLNYPNVGNALNISSHVGETIYGAKYQFLAPDPKKAMPALALGVQVKNAYGQLPTTLKAIGAINSTSGVDFYLAATDLVKFAGTTWVLDGTFRATDANQFGLLGFGGGTIGGHNGYSLEPEFALDAFVAPDVVVGGEYRFAPNNISPAVLGIQEGGKFDFHAAFMAKNFALTAAYLNLSQVGPNPSVLPANTPNQQGLYLQAQVQI
jgi:hypothetical protein